jgi:protein-tyrosine phosphatase
MYRITQALSIGRFASQERESELLAAGITHVLNVSDGPSEIVAKADSFIEVAWVPMADNRRLMESTAVRAIDTLHQLVCVQESHVYVHCVAGLIRSPTVLWLYLIACGLPPKHARDMIEARSPGAAAGHSQMVTDDHVLLAQKHGQRNFLPHPRHEAIVPFPTTFVSFD